MFKNAVGEIGAAFVFGEVRMNHFMLKDKKLIFKNPTMTENTKKNKEKLIENEERIKKIRRKLKEENFILEKNSKNYEYSENEKKLKKLEQENEVLKKKIEKPEDEVKGFVRKNFKIIKESHGFSALILEDGRIVITLHTSKEWGHIWEATAKNIEIDHGEGIIKFVNVPHIMQLNDFKKYFKIENPSSFLENPRFKNYDKEALAKDALKGLITTISQSDKLLKMEFKNETEEILEILQKNGFIIEENGICINPIEKELEEYISRDAIENMIRNAQNIATNVVEGNKMEFIDQVLETYEKYIK